MSPKAILREPLVHFLLLGGALFLWFDWSGGGAGASSTRLVLGAGQIEHLEAAFAKTWQRPPDEAELKGLVDEWVREEIAVRESMAMGLDRDDTVIRRRLRQKFEFLVEDVAALVPPGDAELQAWLAKHPERFRREPEVAFRQVYLSRERRGEGAEADARALLARLAAAGPAAAIEELGDRIQLPQEIELAPLGEVARLFGDGFAEQVGAAAPGSWSGPIASGYGLHLVFVRERIESALPDLAAVRSAVEGEVIAERRRRQLADTYDRLLEKYTVVVEKREASPPAGGAEPGGS